MWVGGDGERGEDGPFELGGLDVEVGLDALCELGLNVGAVAASALASLRSLTSLGSLTRLNDLRRARCLGCRCSKSGTEEAEDGEGLHVEVCIER